MSEDLLNNEISISAELTETGLKASAKARAISALDRLCGSAIDVFASKFESKANRTRTASSVEMQLLKAEGDAAVRIIENEARYGNRAIQNFIKEQERKQNNKDAIAVETIGLLKLSELEDNVDVKGDLDEDWLNSFERHAQEASTERFQKLWAQVLTGEIRKPGSFSLVTLRFMSELDAEIAQLFETAVSLRDDKGEFIVRKNFMGRQLLDLSFLEEVGLLHGVSGSLGYPVKKQDGGFYLYRSGAHGLKIESDNDLRVNIIRITRVGREICKILPPANSLEHSIEVANVLFKDLAKSIELYSLEIVDDGWRDKDLLKKIL